MMLSYIRATETPLSQSTKFQFKTITNYEKLNQQISRCRHLTRGKPKIAQSFNGCEQDNKQSKTICIYH